MPRYLAIHHAPGVSQEDFQRNIPEVLEGKYATFVHTYVNLTNGTIVNIYDGESAEAVAASSSASASRSTRSRRSSSARRPTICA